MIFSYNVPPPNFPKEPAPIPKPVAQTATMIKRIHLSEDLSQVRMVAKKFFTIFWRANLSKSGSIISVANVQSSATAGLNG